jgi:SNF2 family DNA or RNA helicase
VSKPKVDPLVTNAKVYEILKQVRVSKTVSLKPTSMLKSEFVGLDGQVQPFKLRYYQVQAIYHLLAMRRMVLGDAAGTGKTLVLIASLCYAWEKEPANKAIVVTPKSAIRQWNSEFHKFSTGIKTFIVEGSADERKKVYEAFQAYQSPDKAVLLIGYAILVRDWNAGSSRPLLPNGQPNLKAPLPPGLLNRITHSIPSLTVAFDECQAFKSNTTKTWQVCGELSAKSKRCYGLTATLLKNNLIEGFSIYKAIHPDVFTTKTRFLEDYCVTKMQPVGGGRKIPIVVGYRNLQAFRDRIDPYFLGRPKHLISDELPKLIAKEVTVELSSAEEAKYAQALTGMLEFGDGSVKDYEEHKKFVALIYCQQTVDSLSLLKFKAGDQIDTDMFHEEQSEVKELSSKEEALLDLLEEEFDDEKVIVYTRFASHIPRLQELCAKARIKSVAITGDVVDTKANPARLKAQESFQDLKSDIRVIFISDAGSEAINLQAASAMVFYNAPWSWGSYVQLLGRPIRIGSPHQHVVAVHLVSERPKSTAKDRKTIDRYTLDILQKKKKLIDSVLGESAVGALDFDAGDSFTNELIRSLRGSPDTKSQVAHKDSP